MGIHKGTYKNFPYEIRIGNFVCAYIKIPQWHKYYHTHYENIKDIACPGGLTYSGRLHCNLNEWYLGFDYNHPYFDKVFNLCFEDEKQGVKRIQVDIFYMIERLLEK